MNFLKFFRKKKSDDFLDENYNKEVSPLKESNDFCYKSEDDNRDYVVSSINEEERYKKKIDLRKFCPPIRNQKMLGSCASHAVISSYEIQLKQNNSYVEMSELYHYYNARFVNNKEKENVGMTLRQACKTLKKNGLSFEKYWKYVVINFDKKPTYINYWINSLLNKIRRFNVKAYFLVRNIDDLKMWLNKGVPVIIGIFMFPAFNKAFKKKLLTIEDVKGINNFRKYGGHALIVVGYDDEKRAVLIRNSWGTFWGDKGYIWFSYDLFDKVCFEMRTIIK